jgi:sigma-B regulation protein RsbU (phosphoserine phosphatase)
MRAAPLPPDEKERLAALYALNLINEKEEERFDTLTSLASRIFNVPIAYIALIDANRQWFKSEVGLGICGTGRDVSFCSHTILGDDPMIIPDTLQDEKFKTNPLVTGEPFARFYAGIPVRGPQGHKVGTLCLMDRKPRDFSEHERLVLEDLGRLVEREFALVDSLDLQNQLLQTQESLLQSREALEKELSEAAAYVKELTPDPLLEGAIHATSVYIPSSKLGGDMLGYRWLGEDHFGFFLLDVCGHGVGAALLSISIMNVFRWRHRDGAIIENAKNLLEQLNRAFPMDQHNNMYFTMLLGIYDAKTRTLDYASAGHPPPLLYQPTSQKLVELPARGMPIGWLPDPMIESKSAVLEPGSKLYIFSDGLYEFRKKEGEFLPYEEFTSFVSQHAISNGQPLDTLVTALSRMGGPQPFDDDVALIEMVFS